MRLGYGMGISIWATFEMSQCVYTRVLLQHTCYRYLCPSVYYGIPRNTYRTYTKVHRRLQSISRDELTSQFYEKVMLWGDTLNFITHDFTKGPRILNMVMTFVLTQRSHYNTITEPHARFLYFLLEDLIIDFPSHMIVSMKTLLHMISSSFLQLPHAFSHTCTFLFLLPSFFYHACY